MSTIESARAVLKSPALVRVQSAMLATSIVDAAFVTAIAVWAYRVGGPGTVGAYTAVTFATGAVASPLLAAVADRLPRRAYLLGLDSARLVLVALAAACLHASSPLPTLVLAGAVGVLAAPARTAHRSWLPTLADSPGQLTAANATASTLESTGVTAGPALAAGILAAAGVTTTLVALLLGYVAALVLVLGVQVRPAPRTPGAHGGTPGTSSLLTELGAGFALLLGDRNLRAVAGQVCAQTFIGGANRVLLVVLAAQVLGTGSGGLGVLTGVMGAGAIGGGLLALSRVPLGRVGRDLCLGTCLWGLALLPVAVVPTPVLAVVLAVLVGIANPFVDVNLDTALQRVAPEHVLSRVFGAIDALYVASAALGAALAPVLLAHLGLRATLLVVAAPALVAAAASWRRMVDLDARLGEPPATALLRTIPWFARLTPAVLEEVAGCLRAETFAAGSVLVAQGEPGTDFFVIADGRVQVSQDGRRLRDQGPGEYFGEIALLRDVPRTATVVAIEPTVVQRLDRTAFLRALGESGLEDAHRVAAGRLAGAM